MAANQGFRAAFGDPYLYQEATDGPSVAIGQDATSGKWVINAVGAPGATPVGIPGSPTDPQITIEPTTDVIALPYLPFGVLVTDVDGNVSADDGTTTGYVLTSNGAGTTPTFQAAGGGGAVTSVSSDATNVIVATPTTGDVVLTTPNITMTSTNTIMGINATAGSGSLNTTSIGYNALAFAGAGDNVVAIGVNVGASGAINDNCVVIGEAACNNGSGVNNTIIGQNACSSVTIGSNNTVLGYNACSNWSGSEGNNIIIGSAGSASESGVIRIGTDGLQTAGYWMDGTFIINTTGDVFIGQNAGNTSASGSDNTMIGSGAGSSLTSNRFNNGFGALALHACDTGEFNNMYGLSAGESITGGNSNTGFGDSALANLVTGSSNTALGEGAGFAYTTNESSNIVIGTNGTIGDNNVIRIGRYGTSDLQQNIAYILAGQLIMDSSANTFLGFNAGNTAAFVGGGNVAIGNSAGLRIAAGVENVLIGAISGSNIDTGSNNIALGDDSGTAYTSESNNIVIGHTGVASDGNTMRLGTQGSGDGQIDTTFIAGIFGNTIVGAAVLCDSSGALGTVVSSERYKENIEDMGDLSSDIMDLRPVAFNYKSDKGMATHYGLIAEEVNDIMPQLVLLDEEGRPASVAYHELPAMLLNEIQKLNKRIEALEKKAKKKGK